mmetsp:Transcript_18854/g.16118  ORF Transcript_18854/g.16118 Transcript_18854/m.16118 type:complete len:89 (-) Transcript_18854:264-530(-)
MRLPTPTTAAPSSAAPARPEASSCDAASVPSLSPKDNEDSEPDDELELVKSGLYLCQDILGLSDRHLAGDQLLFGVGNLSFDLLESGL